MDHLAPIASTGTTDTLVTKNGSLCVALFKDRGIPSEYWLSCLSATTIKHTRVN